MLRARGVAERCDVRDTSKAVRVHTVLSWSMSRAYHQVCKHGMHIPPSFCLSSDVLCLCDNASGLAKVTRSQRKGNEERNRGQNSFRPSFSVFSLSAKSFTFPIELGRKNSSESHTKRCFSFYSRETVSWLAPTNLGCPELEMHCDQGPGRS